MRPFSFLNKQFREPDYATGVLGNLNVGTGQTVTITGGQIYQYDNIYIAPGGLLNITASINPTQILAKSSFQLEGTIRKINVNTNTTLRVGTLVSGMDYRFNYAQRSGGRGGQGVAESDGNQAEGGGAGSSGHGGGGGGGGYSTGNFGRGGTNGANGTGGISHAGGTTFATFGGSGGGTQYNGSTGQNAANVSVTSETAISLPTSSYGRGGNGASGGGGGVGNAAFFFKSTNGSQAFGSGGGGGGRKGYHGGIIYVMCTYGIGGNGLIDVRGQNGGRGGNGGNASSSGIPDSYAGNGGGGGAGGNGGCILVQAPFFTPSINRSGGSGGAAGVLGGTRGTSGGEWPDYNAAAGQSGLTGSYEYEPDVFRFI